MADLPFEKGKEQVRKYTCFVCGVLFSNPEDYKKHILEKHEEGREFVLCPLERCNFPVRDLRTHYKVKHPHDKMPAVNGMTRALVWKDFKEKGTRGKTKKPKFREGWYESRKMQKALHYRSGYEARIYEYLDQDVEVLAFDVEPFEINYLHKGRQHKYIPDIIVHLTNNKTEIWEVKPSTQTLLEQNQNKWNAAAAACKARGWEFIVITEVGIEKLKNKVKNQFIQAE